MKILDATSGFRVFLKNRVPRDLVCVDIRASVKPDIVADDRFLPFRNDVFGAVYFDPPHKHGYGGFHKERYSGFGSYNNMRALFLRLFLRGSREFTRVLADNGIFVTKLTKVTQFQGDGSNSRHHYSILEAQMDSRFVEYAQAAGLRLVARNERSSEGMSRTARVVWLTFKKS